MPIYEFECQSCSRRFEKIRSQAVDEIDCPTCNGQALRKVSVVSIATKNNTPCPSGGSGFT